MNNTVSFHTTKLDKILKVLGELKQDVISLREKFESIEPLYGSQEWWERSDKQALKSIKEGKGIVIRNKKEIDKFFKNL